MNEQRERSRSYLVIASAIVIAGVLISASLFVAIGQATKTVTSTSVKIVTSTTEVTVATDLTSPCTEQVWNSTGLPAYAKTPVLLAQPGSTSFICVTYQSAWRGNASLYDAFLSSSPFFFVNGTYQFGLGIWKEHCVNNSAGFSCSGFYSHSFEISALPGSIRPSAATDYVSVVYLVDSLTNSTGFYDDSAPLGACGGMPMAVGYSASQVNASDFAPRIAPPCGASPFLPTQVSVGGMDLTYLTP
jgi:hypothetical protein